jgi:uncharacterized membrane protein YfcA
MDDESITSTVIAAVFFAAGMVKGVIGFGLPTVAIGLLGALMRPAEAAALMVLPSLVTNAWQMAAGTALPALLRRLWRMMAGIVAGTLAAAVLLRGADSAVATLALGAVLILYAGAGFASFGFTVPPCREPWLAPLVGAATGAVTAATGVFVLPAVPYLQALRLERDALVQALGLSFTVSTLALSLALWRDGVLARALVDSSLLALAPALAGMAIGQKLRRWLPPDVFRRCFYAGLALLGAYLMLANFRG